MHQAETKKKRRKTERTIREKEDGGSKGSLFVTCGDCSRTRTVLCCPSNDPSYQAGFCHDNSGTRAFTN